MAAESFDLFPDRARLERLERSALCEAIAIESSMWAAKGDYHSMDRALQAIAVRNPAIESATLRRKNGEILSEWGAGSNAAGADAESKDLPGAMTVPIFAGNTRWGELQVRFKHHPGWWGWWKVSSVRMTIFIACICFLFHFIYLRRTLAYLDPSKVVPGRVRAALDSLSGGVLILNSGEQIVLANQSIASTIGRSPSELQGIPVASLPWRDGDSDKALAAPPWRTAIENDQPVTGIIVGLQQSEGGRRMLMVNSTPVQGDGNSRGALVSFEDVTPLEKRKRELAGMLEVIKQSRDNVTEQNKELQRLATIDPLTGCLNRRAFFELLDSAWAGASRHDRPLGCVMVDVDHFKSINDNHGHQMGDEVLRQVAATLKAAAREEEQELPLPPGRVRHPG